MDIRAARWTDRRPLIGAVRLPALRRSTETLAELRLADRADDVLTARVERLAAAMRRRDLAVAARSARALVGLGRGLTPSGDDILAGLLSGMHAFTRGTPSPTADALLDAIWSAIAPDLRDRTTTLSAALLGHAAVGEMATPAADLAVAMVTGGDLTSARERLLAVGHSSGRDLARGLELAGATVTHLFRTSALAITQPAGARS